jgi:hypothetical protein
MSRDEPVKPVSPKSQVWSIWLGIVGPMQDMQDRNERFNLLATKKLLTDSNMTTELPSPDWTGHFG